MDKWQKQYIKNKQWLDNSYLVIPVKTEFGYTAIKKCTTCQYTKYTSEFADENCFDDKKLPVCNKCYNKRKDKKARIKIHSFGFEKECKKCKQQKNLSKFGLYKKYNKLYDICIDCNENPLYKQF